ncbi:MAG: metallophosphoesterase [Betaproteobacteria bacterium]
MRRRSDPRDRLCAGALACLLCACAPTPIVLPTPAPGTDPVRAAFVIVGEGGTAIARVISVAPTCPAIDAGGREWPMRVRAQPAIEPLRRTVSLPSLSKPSAFPVLVCELTLPDAAIAVRVGGRVLPLPRASPRRIVVFGDSGCRIQAASKVYQGCNDARAWPFAQVASAAAALRPDMVVHVGDYHYRENACPDGDAGCAASPWGYGWDAWNADLFVPAAPLLAAAPWLLVRGNHESCDRAGQGWWRFLDPRPLQRGRDCNLAVDDDVGDFSEPYTVPLGTDWQWIVFDSSKVGLAPLSATDAMYVTYRAQYERAFPLGGSRRSFFLSHHPVLGFAPDPSQTPTGLYPGNGSLQSVLRPLYGDRLFPPSVQTAISGHIHLFEAVSFTTGQPTQLIAGTGGDWADVALPRSLPPDATPSPGAVIGSIVWSNQPGFTLMEREDDGTWRVEARDATGGIMTTCRLRETKLKCVPETLP